jgi:WD40 repeat protein
LFDVADWKIITLPMFGPTLDARASFSPDSSLLFCEEGTEHRSTVAVWDLQNQVALGNLSGAHFPVAASSDGRLIAAATAFSFEGSTVRIYDRATLALLRSFRMSPPGFLEHLQFSSDGRFVIADVSLLGDTISLPAYPPRTVRTWDVTSGEESLSFDETNARCASGVGSKIVLSQNEDAGQYLACHDLATRERRWRVRTEHRPLFSGDFRRTDPTSLLSFDPNSLSPDRKFVLCERSLATNGVLDGIARRLKLDRFYESCEYKCGVHETHSGGLIVEVNGCRPCWSPNGQSIATMMDSRAKTIALWDIPPRKSLVWFVAIATLLALPLALVKRLAS